MRRLVCSFVLLFGLATAPSMAQVAPACTQDICWTLLNRFRLFQREADFARHETAWRETSGDARVLDSERRLNAASARGWAADAVDHLCFNESTNTVRERCRRDGADENYLNPQDFRARLDAPPPAGYAGATCRWRIGARPPLTMPCLGAEARLPRAAGDVAVTLSAAGQPDLERRLAVAPRDILVAGMGDSFTSGEGNPDVPVRLAASGFQGVCYGRYTLLRPTFIYLPTRDVQFLARDCGSFTRFDAPAWIDGRARWMDAPCHRSLYGNQLRAALALALDDPHRTVTYLPLGCTGAEIPGGLFAGQASREKTGRSGAVVAPPEGQIGNAARRLATAGRTLDLLLLSIGGNDAAFSGLVANVIVRQDPERKLLRAAKLIVTPDESRVKLRALAPTFAALGRRLKPLVAGEMSRVVYLPYGNVATAGAAKALCGTSRRGFDGHPAFGVDGPTLAETSRYVEGELVPTLERYARAAGMRVADGHREAFAEHGICAADEPAFDRDCFADGDTFEVANGLDRPFRHCARPGADWRPYASRGRWVRTTNDSYLTAMTFADSLPPILKSGLLNDAVWGLSAIVYGGAVHPTAEGHAAMADAALVEAKATLAARGR